MMPDVSLSARDLSALKFAAQFIRGYEQSLEEAHPDDERPITGTRDGEATSDVLAAIVARAEMPSGERTGP